MAIPNVASAAPATDRHRRRLLSRDRAPACATAMTLESWGSIPGAHAKAPMFLGPKVVAEDPPVTHPLFVSEAAAGMMVTPSVKLVRQLGEGGMGAVWIADHLALRTQVVVKFIASGLKGSKEAQDRFSREAAAASQVKSPHVVQTFDHGFTADGIPY